MVYLLSNYWNRTTTVKLISGGWVVYFLATRCITGSPMMRDVGACGCGLQLRSPADRRAADGGRRRGPVAGRGRFVEGQRGLRTGPRPHHASHVVAAPSTADRRRCPAHRPSGCCCMAFLPRDAMLARIDREYRFYEFKNKVTFVNFTDAQ